MTLAASTLAMAMARMVVAIRIVAMACLEQPATIYAITRPLPISLSEGGPFNVHGFQLNHKHLVRPQNVPPFNSYFVDYRRHALTTPKCVVMLVTSRSGTRAVVAALMAGAILFPTPISPERWHSQMRHGRMDRISLQSLRGRSLNLAERQCRNWR